MAKPLLALAALLFAFEAAAERKTFTLAADPALAESGLLNYILPRFSLKTGIRPALVEADGDATLGAGSGSGAGDPAFQRGGEVYRIAVRAGPGEEAAGRFRDWLLSDIGVRAVLAFVIDGEAPYARVEAVAAAAAVEEVEGDAALGSELALRRCGRCHVIDKRNRFGGIGSTPSFGAMKNLPNWRARFEAFWTLNPHPAFTQIADVTEPFDPTRPSPIAPLELTIDEVDAIVAFVVKMERKDLGGALATQ